MKLQGINISRKELKAKGTAASQILTLLATLTSTNKDDAFAQILSHLFTDAEHFDNICTMLGLPPDGLAPTT